MHSSLLSCKKHLRPPQAEMRFNCRRAIFVMQIFFRERGERTTRLVLFPHRRALARATATHESDDVLCCDPATRSESFARGTPGLHQNAAALQPRRTNWRYHTVM